MTESVKDCALVSVIVPVYNVEKYLARCMDSIIAQTYKNLEILLIDDGSTDSSGKICDEYAEKDSRIRVIHQENQGLAEVSNIGLREAKGEWIQFVDSDDWIDAETIETCYNLSQKYNVDMVIFSIMTELENEKHLFYNHNHSYRLQNKYDVLRTIAFASVSRYNKFSKASLYKGVEYPKGKLYEDIATTHKVIANAERILDINIPFYHYYVRGGSILRSSFSPKTYDLVDGIQKFSDFVMNFHDWNEQEQKDIYLGICFRKLLFVDIMIKTSIPESYDMKFVSNLRKEIDAVHVIRCKLLSRKRKIKMLLFKFNFRLYRKVYLKFRRDKV